jgi:rubrerythrin
MVGLISSGDILRHPIITIRCFGWRVFFRAIFAWRNVTFLSLLCDTEAFQASVSDTHSIYQRCRTLELQVKNIYVRFAKLFVGTERVCKFFRTIAAQEQDHADLLHICDILARNARKKMEDVAWHDQLTLLEEQIRTFETNCSQIRTAEQALQAVLQMEASEINNIFVNVVKDTESEFVNKYSIFQVAMKLHLKYICRKIANLAPRLTSECETLLKQFSSI